MKLLEHPTHFDVLLIYSFTAHDAVHEFPAELIKGVEVPEQATHLLDAVLRNSVVAQEETQALPKELTAPVPQLTHRFDVVFNHSLKVAHEAVQELPVELITGVAPEQTEHVFVTIFKYSVVKQEVTHLVPVESTYCPEGHDVMHCVAAKLIN
jgi:hypothetical protein